MATSRTDLLYPSKAPGNYINAKTYKSNCAGDFGFKEENSWGVERTRAGGLVSTKVQNYNHLARTIDAIEAGRKESWFSGFSNAATDVAEASIELLEDCRERLVKLEETIKNNKSLSAAQKAKKLKDERAKILDTLKLIRNANNPKMYNLKWLSDFYAEGKKFINSKNVGIMMVCIAIPVIAALFLPTPLTAIVLAGLALFLFVRFVSGLCKAASAANQKSMEESGQKVKEMADLMIERDAKQLPQLKKDLIDAEQEAGRITARIDSLESDYSTMLTNAAMNNTDPILIQANQMNESLLRQHPEKSIAQHIEDLQERVKGLKTKIAGLHSEWRGLESSANTQARRNELPQHKIRLQAKLGEYEREIAFLEQKRKPLLERKKEIEDLKVKRSIQQKIVTSTQPKIQTLEARQASAQARQKSTGPNQTESIEDLYEERTRAERGKF